VSATKDNSLSKSCLNCHNPPASRGIFRGPACRVAYNRRKRNKTVTPQGRVILSICDFTGVWSDPYRRAGYRVVQWDAPRIMKLYSFARNANGEIIEAVSAGLRRRREAEAALWADQ
jgi:hypothetical protein